MERYWRYNALDCYNTLLGTLFMLKLLSGNRAMQKAFQDAMLRNFTGLRMSMRGFKADQKRRDFHRKNLVAEMNRETEKLRFLLDDPEFNINSGPQKCSLLYDVFGLPERTARGKFVDQNKQKTGKNAPSAGAIPVMMAKTEHPLFAYILNPLEKALAPRVQMSNLFGFPDPDAPSGVRGGIYMPTGRFRYSLNPVGTETTRFSGKKSNFWEGTNPQNIRGDYKDWIVSDENHIFLDVDYSQSDDVFIAYESQDPDKIALVESGLDAHAVNGELFFGVALRSPLLQGRKLMILQSFIPSQGFGRSARRASMGPTSRWRDSLSTSSCSARPLFERLSYSVCTTRPLGVKIGSSKSATT
jgi:DNA polymerase I-like protein with 3'-5' exonuclease and polymerase domains